MRAHGTTALTPGMVHKGAADTGLLCAAK